MSDETVERLDEETERLLSRVWVRGTRHMTREGEDDLLGKCPDCKRDANALRNRIRELVSEARKEGEESMRQRVEDFYR